MVKTEGSEGRTVGSSSSKSKTKWSSKSQEDYADWTKPAGQQGLSDLNDLYQQGKNNPAGQVYQGDRVIGDFNPDTNKAIDAIGANAGAAEHTTTDLDDMVKGGVNPYFEQYLNNNLQKLGDRLSNSAAYGGTGTSDTGRLISRELGDAATNAMNEQWNQTEARRIAANQAQQQAFANRNNLLQSAVDNYGKRDVLRQAQLDANREKWSDTQAAPWENLGRFIEGLNSLRAGTGSSVSSGKSSTKNTQSASPFDVAKSVGQIGTSIFGMGNLFGANGVAGLFGRRNTTQQQ